MHRLGGRRTVVSSLSWQPEDGAPARTRSRRQAPPSGVGDIGRIVSIRAMKEMATRRPMEWAAFDCLHANEIALPPSPLAFARSLYLQDATTLQKQGE